MLPRFLFLIVFLCLTLGCSAPVKPPSPLRPGITVAPDPTITTQVPSRILELPVTPTTSPVSGTLVLQNGMCCAGGKVGNDIKITAQFSASSPDAVVTQMRTLNHCGSAEEFAVAEWEAFVPQKEYSYRISVPNWVGWYLAVQYKDTKGNLSPIYCDDISVEGMPA